MSTQRQYEASQIFNCQAVDIRHLWEPSREYKGKPSDKPNWFSMFRLPKTQAAWFNEPALAGVAQACLKFGSIMQMYNYNQNSVVWPIVDGDMPSAEGKSSEFAKGHWLFSGSSNTPPNVELVQAGGTLVKLPGKVGVKSGDHCMVGVSAAIAQNAANRIKFYLNAVVFTSPGEEIVFANSVSGAELMRMAQAQGLQVAGFTGAPGFGQSQGGFQPQPGPQGFTPQQFGAQPQGGFGAPQPGFTQGPGPGGFAPSAGSGNPATNTAPAPFGTAGNGNVTFPSNPPGAPGFGQPGAQFGQPGASLTTTYPSNPGPQQGGFGGTPNFAPGFGQR